MRYATFSVGGDSTPRLGVLSGGGIVDVSTLHPSAPRSLLDFIRSGPEAWLRIADRASDLSRGRSHDVSTVHWYAPIPRPAKKRLLPRTQLRRPREGSGEGARPGLQAAGPSSL